MAKKIDKTKSVIYSQSFNFGTASKALSTFRSSEMEKLRERVAASDEASTTFTRVIQLGVTLKAESDGKPTQAQWNLCNAGIDDAECPNAHDTKLMLRALLGCSRAGSMGAKRAKENGGGLVRDSHDATRVVLREKGIESFSKLMAYFSDPAKDRVKAIRATVKAIREQNPADPKVWLAKFEADVLKALLKDKEADAKANEAKVKEAAKAKAARDKINAKAALKRAAEKAKKAKAEEARLAKLAA